jgi:uncharacterized membrane protein YidH (DUF202 family)
VTGTPDPEAADPELDAAELDATVPDAYERDPGLAAERTQLAWGRSTLSLLVCGVAVARGLPLVGDAAGDGIDPEPLAGAAVLAMGGLAWLAGLPYARARAKASHAGQRHMVTPRELAPIAFGTVLVGVAALVLDLFLG